LTPNAEFNFWVDPEAAYVVLHSGIPMSLTTLNVCRKTDFSKRWYDQIISVDTPLSRLIKERLGPKFENDPNHHEYMYDELTVAALIDPMLVKTVDLYVDIDIAHGPNYGTSVGGTTIWEGAESAVRVPVQYGVDFDRFMGWISIASLGCTSNA
jgi:inosine-uridine nucleoside N-ribohydrolase